MEIYSSYFNRWLRSRHWRNLAIFYLFGHSDVAKSFWTPSIKALQTRRGLLQSAWNIFSAISIWTCIDYKPFKVLLIGAPANVVMSCSVKKLLPTVCLFWGFCILHAISSLEPGYMGIIRKEESSWVDSRERYFVSVWLLKVRLLRCWSLHSMHTWSGWEAGEGRLFNIPHLFLE